VRRATRATLAALCALPALGLSAPAAGAAGFAPGSEGFAAAAIADGGAPASSAGSHPYQLNLRAALEQSGAGQDLRELKIEMPTGLIANPNALLKCRLADFRTPRTSPFEASLSGESCPLKAQIGTVDVKAPGGGQVRRFGLFNLDPPPGIAAQIGAAPFGHPIVFNTFLRPNPDGSYVLSLAAADIPQALELGDLQIGVWGIPWNPSHNVERGNCLNEAEPSFAWAKCSVGEAAQTPLAYLSLPTNCLGPLAFTAIADSYQQPTPVSAVALNGNSGDNPVDLIGCPTMTFAPQTLGFLTDEKASSASGYNFRLTNDNIGLLTPHLRAPSQTKTAILTLPDGVTINPSLGEGLLGCSAAQYAGEGTFSAQGTNCPNGSKIGDFSVRTPLFDELIRGAIYLAAPDDPATGAPGSENPFDALLAVYLVARSQDRGVMVKVPGKLVPDQASGRITAVFDALPQIPYTDLDVNFRSGQRAPLITPPACGAAISEAVLIPWAAGVANAARTNSSLVKTGIEGGPCPDGLVPPFKFGVVAGGVNANVNSYTPYFVHLTRKDSEQEITSYSLSLPKGITGKLAGIPFCPEAQIAAARVARGFAETAHPSCPPASQVGRTLAGYGVGPALTYAPGRVYLAGPYHGAPLSLVTVNAATVGPFDLGTVVIRSAFTVDPYTAQLQIDSRASDPIPHILSGIPLHLRDIRVYMDRPQFTHNPSSCEASALVSTLTGSGARFGDPADDTLASASTRFQLLNCLNLGFRPKLGIRLRGGTRRGAYPQLRATFAARGPGDSNLDSIEVNMPHSEFLAQNHIRGICTRPQFAADKCPPGSVYGAAVAYTPLLDEPLRGNVYLRSSSNRLPDLVASLHSGAIQIVLEGKIGPSRKGGIRANFTELPDEPLDRFVMILNGGKRGLLVNSTNVCANPPIASVKALAQNNVGALFTTTLRGQCNKGKAKGKARKRGERR
jgi:hypothetical protein